MTHSIYVTMAPRGSRVTVRMDRVAKTLLSQSLQSHQNLVPLDLYRKLAVDEGFAGLMLPRTHIELPPVPGAGDDAALQFAFAERPPLMRANAVESMDCPFDIEESHDSVSGYTLFGRSRGKFMDVGNLVPGSHFWLSAPL